MSSVKKHSPIKKAFCEVCPRQLTSLPNTYCPLGKLVNDSKNPKAGCQWYINSSEDNYCFWSWLKRVSDSNGLMDPLSQHQIATLLGLSSSKMQTAYKELMEKLRNSEEFKDIKDLISKD